MIFEKGMNSCLSNVGFDRNPSRKAGFNERPRFPLAFKETGSAPDIY